MALGRATVYYRLMVCGHCFLSTSKLFMGLVVKHKKLIAGSLTTAICVGVYLYEPATEFTVWMHGSENVQHDLDMAAGVDQDTQLGNYCTTDTSELLEAADGDVVISTRADSVYCRYTSPAFNTIPVVGWSNDPEFVGNEPIANALSISAGAAWGYAHRYYLPCPTLSDAMVEMANIISAVNLSRIAMGRPPASLQLMERFLSASSDQNQVVSGRYYGQHIDLDEAIQLATAATGTAFLSSVYLLLE